MNSKQKAFTLIEVLLTVALISLLFALTMPVVQTFQFRNEVQVATGIVAQSLRTAQLQAKSGKHDSQWGVRLQGSSITIFSGDTYATRNTTYDFSYQTASNVGYSGLTEVIFSKLLGLPNTSGTIILSSPHNLSQTVSLNAQGTVSY